MDRQIGERLLLGGLVVLALLFVGLVCWYAGGGWVREATMPQPKALMLGRWS